MLADQLMYNLRMALKNWMRRPWMSIQITLIIAFGIGGCCATFSALISLGGITPGRAWRDLYHPQLEPRAPDKIPANGMPPRNLSLRDAEALFPVLPANRRFMAARNWLPFTTMGENSVFAHMLFARAATANFLTILGGRFIYGSTWSDADDSQKARYVVISKDLNDKIFSGTNSVGKRVEIATQPFTVIGVVELEAPIPKFYDLQKQGFSANEDIYLPFHTWLDLPQDYGYGAMECWGATEASSQHNPRDDSCSWVQVWAELNRDEVSLLRTHLKSYSAEQIALGRFSSPGNVNLMNAEEWIAYNHVFPDAVKLQAAVSICILLICLFNAIGLQAVQVRGRYSEMAIRRALGASKLNILQQILTESLTLGMSGAALGLAFGFAEVALLRQLPQSYAHLYHIDPTVAVLCVCASMLGALLVTTGPAIALAKNEPTEHLRLA